MVTLSVMAIAAADPRLEHRTEQRVAADVIAALIADGCMGATPSFLRRVAQATRVPVVEIERARRRIYDVGYVPPSTLVIPDADRPTAITPIKPITNPRGGGAKASEKVLNAPPGKSWCSRHTNDDGSKGAYLDKHLFPMTNVRTGKLKTWCRECCAEYQRTRYLSLEATRLLGHVRAHFALVVGDAAVGMSCPLCQHALKAGDLVTGEVALAHVTCPT